MSALGFVLPAASIGLGALLIKPRRGFFPFNEEGEALTPIVAQTTIEELHRDSLEITEHPIEQGAAISDHAYKRPVEVIITCGWSNSPSGPSSLISQAVGLGAAIGGTPVGVLASAIPTINAAQSLLSGNAPDQVRSIYEKLLALQSDRVPFDIYTGKRVYHNMLLQQLATDTRQETENSGIFQLHCREVLIVSTRVVSIPPSQQSQPEKTNSITDLGPQSLFTPRTFQTPSIPGLLSNFS